MRLTDREFVRIPHTEAGVWLEGSQGWHNSYRVVDRAELWGWDFGKAAGEDVDEIKRIVQAYRDGANTDDEGEIMIGISNDATDYLCEIAPWGFTFDWDAGELSLCETEMQADEVFGLDRTCDGLTLMIDTARYTGAEGPTHVSVLDHAEGCAMCRVTLADFIDGARQARNEEKKG